MVCFQWTFNSYICLATTRVCSTARAHTSSYTMKGKSKCNKTIRKRNTFKFNPSWHLHVHKVHIVATIDPPPLLVFPRHVQTPLLFRHGMRATPLTVIVRHRRGVDRHFSWRVLQHGDRSPLCTSLDRAFLFTTVPLLILLHLRAGIYLENIFGGV